VSEKAFDVIVIGGGLIGLGVAREIASRAGSSSRVLLIERNGTLGAESSHAAAGMLAPQAEADRADAFFQLACESRDLYPAWSEELKEETGVDIEHDRTGTFYLALNEHDERELEERFRWQRAAGLPVENFSADEVSLFEPNLTRQVRMALRFPLDSQVEPRRLLTALITSAEARGARLLTGTQVISLQVRNNRVCGVETSAGAFAAGAVIIASGAWTSFIKTPESTRLQWPAVFPVRGQMLCFAARPPLISHVVYSPRGYLVPRRGGRLLAGSTTERVGFNKSVTGAGVRSVASQAIEIAPAVGELPLIDSWAGLRPATEDGYPLLGESAQLGSLYFATGHYRNGVLLAPLTARLIADTITERTVAPIMKHFAPERFFAHTSVG
jgi:glycine oxidase